MPKIAGRRYPYTPAGRAAAKKEAGTAKSVTNKKKAASPKKRPR